MEAREAWPHGGWSGPKKWSVGVGQQAAGQLWAWGVNLRTGDTQGTLRVLQASHFQEREQAWGEASLRSQ